MDKIWLVGGCSTVADTIEGKVYSGYRGMLLDRALQIGGMNRPQVELKMLYPKGPLQQWYKDKSCFKVTLEGLQWQDKLLKDITKHKPCTVVALGPQAMQCLTGHTKIEHWRGSLVPFVADSAIKVYPTYAPSMVMKMMQEPGLNAEDKKRKNLYPTFIQDFKRIGEVGFDRNFRRPIHNTIINPTYVQAIEFIKNIPNGTVSGCDIETVPGTGVITRVGLSIGDKKAISIPFWLRGKGYPWSESELVGLLKVLGKYLLRTDIKKIFHNGMYDLVWLKYFWGLEAKGYEDTMLLQHACYPGQLKSLAYCTSVYTWNPYYKDQNGSWDMSGGNDVLSIYNAKDCCITAEVWGVLKGEERRLGISEGYKRSLSYMPSLIEMATKGMKFDTKRQAELDNQFSEQIQDQHSLIESIMGRKYHITAGATKDLYKLLYEDRGYPKQYYKRKISTDGVAIRTIGYMYPDDPIPKAVISIRKLLKLQQTYLQMKVADDGRIKTSYNPAGTGSWRLSSSASSLGCGANFQNIPKHPDSFTGLNVGIEIRKLFKPDEGKVLVAADYSQGEARILAWLMKDYRAMEAYQANQDVHWLNAKLLLNLEPDLEYDPKNPQHKLWRQMGKTAKHATNYAMQALGLQRTYILYGIFIPLHECIKQIEQLYSKCPELGVWQASIRDIARTTRTLITPLNRKRYFGGRLDEGLFRSMYSFKPQSTLGELTCMGIRDVHAEGQIKQKVLEVLMNVHDECMVQCDEQNVDKVCSIMRKGMEKELIIEGEKLIIPIDFKVSSKNWGEMEDYKPKEM